MASPLSLSFASLCRPLSYAKPEKSSDRGDSDIFFFWVAISRGMGKYKVLILAQDYLNFVEHSNHYLQSQIELSVLVDLIAGHL